MKCVCFFLGEDVSVRPMLSAVTAMPMSSDTAAAKLGEAKREEVKGEEKRNLYKRRKEVLREGKRF